MWLSFHYLLSLPLLPITTSKSAYAHPRASDVLLEPPPDLQPVVRLADRAVDGVHVLLVYQQLRGNAAGPQSMKVLEALPVNWSIERR